MSFKKGDRVQARDPQINEGHGINPGDKGTITDVSGGRGRDCAVDWDKLKKSSTFMIHADTSL